MSPYYFRGHDHSCPPAIKTVTYWSIICQYIKVGRPPLRHLPATPIACNSNTTSTEGKTGAAQGNSYRDGGHNEAPRNLQTFLPAPQSLPLCFYWRSLVPRQFPPVPSSSDSLGLFHLPLSLIFPLTLEDAKYLYPAPGKINRIFQKNTISRMPDCDKKPGYR